jgi:hypothetical protein
MNGIVPRAILTAASFLCELNMKENYNVVSVYPKALVSVGRGLKRTNGDIEESVLAELAGHVGTRVICTELQKQGYIEGSSGY